MARYVDLDKVEKFRRSYCNTTNMSHCNRNCAECYYNNGGAEDVSEDVSEDVIPVVHAKWTKTYHKFKNCSSLYLTFNCSNCDCFALFDVDGAEYPSEYCPNCGAKMDKG